MKVVDLVHDKEVSQLKQDLQVLKKEKQTFIEFEQIQAELIRVKYLSLVKSGFSALEALELCKR
jgi:hypothetical protein